MRYKVGTINKLGTISRQLMIKIDFRYKPFYERITLKGYFHKKFEKLLFFLYNNNLYKKLKLNKNEMLRYTVEYKMKSKILHNIYESNLPENLEIEPHSFTFLDALEIENITNFKSELITLTSKYDAGFLSGQPNSEIHKSLERFPNEYKGVSWGKIYYNNLKRAKKADLIDGISYQYIKGEQSHLIICYTVFPSAKFKNLFQEILKIQPTEKHNLRFYSFKRAIKKRRSVSTIQHTTVFASETLTKLYNEINFQCKEFLSNEISSGIFLQSPKYLFPSIICYKYNPELYNKHSNEYLRFLNIERNSNYYDTETKQLFSAPNIDLTNKAAEYFQYFIPLLS